MEELYYEVNKFLKKYPMTVAFRLRNHIKVLSKHLNPGEEVIYIFPAQLFPSRFTSTCILALTNKRILISQKRVLPGYMLNSITPDLFNDFQVHKGWFWGNVTIDTVKEEVRLVSIDSRALVEIETSLSEYLSKIKPKFVNRSQN